MTARGNNSACLLCYLFRMMANNVVPVVTLVMIRMRRLSEAFESYPLNFLKNINYPSRKDSQ